MTMTALVVQGLAQAFVGRFLNTALEAAAVALLAAILLLMAGRRNSGTRFAIWFLALLVIAALPLAARHSVATGQAAPAGFTISAAWATGLFAAWASVVLLLLLRVGFGLLSLRRLRKECTEVDLAARPELARLMKNAGTRQARLCVSEQIHSPSALGFFHPAIVLPAWALRELPESELRVIVLHELAHLRRWDDWTNLAQKVVKALFFFHPAVWWIERRLALEREMACDELVLSQVDDPKTYAESLVTFAERLGKGREVQLAQAATGSMRQITCRLTQILDARRSRATRIWKPVLALGTALSVAAIIAVPYVPRLVAFDAGQPITPPAIATVAGAPLLPGVKATQVSLRKPASRRHAPEVLPAKMKTRATPVRPPLLRASLKDIRPLPEMFLVMHPPSAPGLPPQVLCIWRFQSTDAAGNVRTTIVMSSI